MIHLDVENLSIHYGAICAIRQVSFSIKRGHIVTLIGSNGAGKTSILRALSGLIQPSAGKVVFDGKPILGLKTHQIARIGMSHVPEGRGIFLNLTVADNLELGTWSNRRKGLFTEDQQRILALFPRLKERFSQNAGTLSGGEQQMLAMARALMAYPDILLLDEPSLGLAPQMIAKIFRIIQQLNAEHGVTILLVEQNALQALRIAHRGIVLETGSIVAEAPASELLASDLLRQSYLGSS